MKDNSKPKPAIPYVDKSIDNAQLYYAVLLAYFTCDGKRNADCQVLDPERVQANYVRVVRTYRERVPECEIFPFSVGWVMGLWAKLRRQPDLLDKVAKSYGVLDHLSEEGILGQAGYTRTDHGLYRRVKSDDDE